MIDLNDLAPPVPVAPGVIDLNDVAPPPARYDLDELSRRLADQAESWVPRLFPNGRPEGNEWRLANIGGGRPRKTGSCVIPLTGAYAGCFHDFDTQESGGPLKTLEHATGLRGRELFDYAAGLVGLPAPAQPPRRGPRRSRDEEIEREIAFIVSQTRPPAGTGAAAYLAARGLPVPASPDLLFHPCATYHDTATGHPALIARVRDGAGRRLGIHRTYLADDGSGKAAVPKPRMMLGPVAGGTVQLVPLGAGPVLGIAEGIETALSAHGACPALPVWAALSAGNLERFEPPAPVTRLVLLADHDASGTGRKAAERAAARHHAAGRRVWIALPPRPGDDFNDLLRREGVEAVRAVIEGAAEWQPGAPLSGASPTAPEEAAAPARPGGNRPVGFQPGSGRLPMLRADNGNLAEVTDRCWEVLHAANQPPWLYRCAARPAWIERDDQGRPVPVPITDDRLRHILAQLVAWTKQARTGDLVPAWPPAGVVKNVLATPDPALPVLAGIVTAPVFGAGGELVTTPGYHPATALLYEPPDGFVPPPVPERPTGAEIAAARALLLDELLGDFPFTGEAERAHVLALLLLPFLRPMIQGPTPLHLIEKPEAGTGATLMVDVIATVTTGASINVMVDGRDDEEWRKRLTAKLRQIPTLLLIDNLRRPLDSSAVAAALTAPVWEDRILGKSENTHFPIRCAWVATGNNPEFSNEMARRLVRIRLDARTDQPWLRHGFRHGNLLAWVRENRGRLVAACLTLGRAWVAAGRPRPARTIGSFEEWSHVLGGVLAVAGVPGFLGNLKETYETTNAEGSAQTVFITAWWDRYGPQPVGAADLYDLAITCDPALPLGEGSERSQRTRLGILAGRLRDRVFRLGGTVVLMKALGVRHRAQQWALLPQVEKNVVRQRSPEKSPSDQGHGERCDRGGTFSATAVPAGERGTSDQRSPPGSPEKAGRDQGLGERWEPGEPFASLTPIPTRTHACTRAHRGEEGDKTAQTFPRPPTPGNCSDRCPEPRGDVPATSPPAAAGDWEELL